MYCRNTITKIGDSITIYVFPLLSFIFEEMDIKEFVYFCLDGVNLFNSVGTSRFVAGAKKKTTETGNWCGWSCWWFVFRWHLGSYREKEYRNIWKSTNFHHENSDCNNNCNIVRWSAPSIRSKLVYSKILQVFNVIPTDKLRDFVEVQMYIAKVPLSEAVPQVAEEYLRDLTGNLVEFPLHFLANVNLAPGLASKEGIIPSSVFTWLTRLYFCFNF